jgi:ATP-dependent DNA helicase DinG
LRKARPLVVEAGTGTGKTYAYLAPALRPKKGDYLHRSKALQDQLYSRDLPTVAKALKFTGKLALLKGRSNYLCLERLEQQALAAICRCKPSATSFPALLVESNQDGDISTCVSVAEDSGLAAGDQHQR